jgi:hypothetical protein
MNRVRWFRASLPMSLRSMAAKISSSPLELDGDMGFKVEKIRTESVDASYYERFSWIESGVDPFGREFSFERVGYKVVRFTLSKNYPELQVIDAPRGLSSLFSRIAELTDFGATIEPLRIDVLRWASSLQNSYTGSFRVASMSVSDLGVEEGITGSLTVSSRDQDVKAATGRLLSRRAYSVQRVQVVMRSQASDASLTLISDGSVKSSSDIDADILIAVRQAVPPQQ